MSHTEPDIGTQKPMKFAACFGCGRHGGLLSIHIGWKDGPHGSANVTTLCPFCRELLVRALNAADGVPR